MPRPIFLSGPHGRTLNGIRPRLLVPPLPAHLQGLSEQAGPVYSVSSSNFILPPKLLEGQGGFVYVFTSSPNEISAELLVERRSNDSGMKASFSDKACILPACQAP